jgi:acyl-homoserine-lactone acylase
MEPPLQAPTSARQYRRKFPAVSVLSLLLLGCAPSLRPPRTSTQPLAQLEPETLARQVEVIRTEYGVPHIYADNLQALGYALGYLQLEDYGDRVAMGMIRARGELARYSGRRALDSDFESRPYYLLAREVYFRLEQGTRDVYEGFAAGVNRYIENYPDEFPPWMLPEFTGHDVAALYVYRPNPRQVRRWVERIQDADDAPLLDLDGNVGQGLALLRHQEKESDPNDPRSSIEEGSSAWALAPARTVSNAAILMRNPHLGWDAGYWEVHTVVPGRLDFYGDFRIGGPLGIIGGFNPRLGFATTNNSVDNTEVYALEADPDREDHYLLDGASLPIRRESMTLPYRDGEGYSMETRERLSTVLGPVIYQKHGRIYVLRTPQDGEFRAGEQFLRLIQSTNLEEWTEAMRLRAHPGSNFTYADADGNIFYIWNAAIPIRPHPAGGNLAIPATRMDQVWTELHDLKSLPQLLNPAGGYLRDENDGPWFTNMREPLDPEDYPDYFEENEFGLRSQHSVLLLDNDARLSLEDVVRLKHSYRILLADRVKNEMIQAVRKLDETLPAHSGRNAALALLESWDNTASPESRGSVLFTEWWRIYSESLPAGTAGAADDDAEPFAEPWSADRPMDTPRGLAYPGLAARLFDDAVDETVRRFGSLDVAWGTVHRVRRGSVDEPVGGCPGALGCFRVLNFTDESDGRRSVDGGDGWVIAVEFTDPPRAYSILGYGQSAREESPHYADQAALFARGEMKSVAFTRESVERGAIRRYRPGY